MNLRLLLVFAPAALALATFAQAQPPGPSGGAPVVRMIHGGPGGGPEMKAMHEAMMKQHLEDLKTVLRLRPDQEPALAAFVATHGPHGPPDGMMMMHGGPPDMKAQTTPERLAEMAKHDAAMAAEHETSRQALAKFYAALSPDQQKVFDALQRLNGPHMGPMGGPIGGGDHGGMRRIIIRKQGGPEGGAHPGHEPD